LQQDTILKKQKQTITKEKYRIEYAESVLQAFTDAFSDVKNILIGLKLNKSQMQNFQAGFKKSLKKFEVNLKKMLSDADKR
jgi:hypothetical protein